MSVRIYNVQTKTYFTIPGGITLPNGIQQSLGETLTPEAIAAGWRYYRPAPHGERYNFSTWIDSGEEYVEATTDYTDSEWAIIVAQREAAAAAAEAAAKAIEQDLDEYERRMKAVVLVLVDEINLLRGWVTGFKAEVAAATSLADLKARVATTPNMPARTGVQAKAVIAAKVAELQTK